MIKVIVGHTIETTDLDYAIDELTAQINNKGPLLRNTAALLFCNYEFIQSGLVRELCIRLPFPLLGCSSQVFAVQNAGEELMLTLMVLTSDDVEFYAGVSGPLVAGNESALETLYRDLTMQETPAVFKPSLMLIFPPFLDEMTGNTVVRVLDEVSGGIPIFGSVAVDITTSLRSPVTIFNGATYSDRLTMLLMKGPVHPRFFAYTLPGEPRFRQKFTITRAEGNKIVEIDGRPAVEFLERLGIINNKEGVEVLYAFPVVVDHEDGTPSRVFIISKVGRDGSLLSEQDVPAGETANIGTISGSLVIASTRQILERVKEIADSNGLLLVSCFSRVLTLQDPLEEVNLVIKQLRNWSTPFVFFSSGGEVCPVLTGDQGKFDNAFHQFTITACVF
jgi:hypothetical protein